MPNLLAKHVMPNADLHNLRRLHLSNGFESVSIATEDNNVLDGMVYRERSMLKLESSKQKWIIMFLGNGAHYEHCADEARNLAISWGRNVLVFNDRGGGRSAGRALEEMDLIKDGAACLKFLLRNYQVTDTRNVVLFGHSLGGAIATSIHTTKSFQGHLINDRSFSSLASVPLSWIEIVPSVRRRSVTYCSPPHHTRAQPNIQVQSILPVHLKEFLKFVVRFVVSEIRWSMDAGRALLLNPSKLSRSMIVWHKDDEIINFTHASLHSALKSRGSQFLGLELTASRASSPHNLTIVNDPQWRTFVDMARQLLSDNNDDDGSMNGRSHVVDSKCVGGNGIDTTKKRRRVL